jgi:hypothetical protein
MEENTTEDKPKEENEFAKIADELWVRFEMLKEKGFNRGEALAILLIEELVKR